MNKLLENACDYGERLEWARGDLRWGYPTRSDRGPSPEHRAAEDSSIRAGAEVVKDHFEAWMRSRWHNCEMTIVSGWRSKKEASSPSCTHLPFWPND